MSTYSADQLHVIREIKRIGRRRYGNDPAKYHRYVKANLEIGAVETHFRNLSGGDADSAGYRQERASLYSNPTNLRAAINRAYDEMEQHDHGQAPGLLAADIQRPRADLRGRYHDARGEAARLLGSGGSGGAGAASLGTPGHTVGGTAPQLHPGGTETDSKAAMLAALLNKHGGSLMDRFRYEMGTGQYTTTTAPSVTPGKSPYFKPGTAPSSGTLNSGGGNSRLGRIKARADKIDAQHRPYLYGGGHGGNTNGPLDCSAAVSKVLGINVRVSGEFMKWGKPGQGKDLTVYANGEHVLVKIGGHFWGTSAANPRGGAGWIPAGQISKSYLSRFTARHI